MIFFEKPDFIDKVVNITEPYCPNWAEVPSRKEMLREDLQRISQHEVKIDVCSSNSPYWYVNRSNPDKPKVSPYPIKFELLKKVLYSFFEYTQPYKRPGIIINKILRELDGGDIQAPIEYIPGASATEIYGPIYKLLVAENAFYACRALEEALQKRTKGFYIPMCVPSMRIECYDKNTWEPCEYDEYYKTSSVQIYKIVEFIPNCTNYADNQSFFYSIDCMARAAKPSYGSRLGTYAEQALFVAFIVQQLIESGMPAETAMNLVYKKNSTQLGKTTIGQKYGIGKFRHLCAEATTGFHMRYECFDGPEEHRIFASTYSVEKGSCALQEAIPWIVFNRKN